MASALITECIAMTNSRTKSKQSRPRKPRKGTAAQPSASPSAATKTASLLALLSKPEGVTVEMMAYETGCQTHSIRGFLAGHVRKKLDLKLSSEKEADGVRRYRIIQA